MTGGWRIGLTFVGLWLTFGGGFPAEAQRPPAEGWPMFRAGPSHPGRVETPGLEAPGGTRWELATHGPVRSSAAVVDGVVYVGSGDGHLYAVDARSGRVRWRYDAGSPIHSSPAVAGGLVYFTDRASTLLAVGRHDGALRWKVETGPTIPWQWGYEGWDYYSSSPLVSDGLVVFGAGDGRVRAVDAVTGDLRWSHATGGRIRATPAVAGGTVYVGSGDGRFYALGLADGDSHWTFETRGVDLRAVEWGFDRQTIQSSATVTDDAVYFGSRDARIYALDRGTGRELWSADDGGTTAWVISTPAVVDGAVYFGRSSSGKVQALDAATGEERWETERGPAVWASPVVVEGLVYTADESGEVVARNASDGSPVWRLPTGSGTYASPVIQDGVLYIGNEAGSVFALEAARGPAPRRAVFWDDSLSERAVLGRSPEHRRAVDHLTGSGYRELDGPALSEFLAARIEDRAPSVVVFGMDAIPRAVAAEPRDGTLLHRYLESGGKVVWLGYPPFMVVRDLESGRASLDRGRPSRFTGVDHGLWNGDSHTHRATPAGRSWGLEGWWMGPRGLDPTEVTTILAADEAGRAVSWVRSFGGPPGTGWVQLMGLRLGQRLDEILRVADYGVFRSAQ